MRLFIAGILTLAIYLLTCAYGNEERKVPEVSDTPTSIDHLRTQPDCQTIYNPLYPFHSFPPIFLKGIHSTEAQTFPNV